ncbi:MAG: GNAT family N-acetyltransferase [Oscillospiraceae bacterium]|nr:GNAT family N-acetyltransferase [Oscillospiraceae bacterium]
MNIRIEKATIDDAEILTEIQKQAFEPLYRIYHDEGNPYLRGVDELKYQIEHGTREVYKILADDIICGGITIRDKGNGEYYLNRIYISPQFQSKGIGKTAIGICEQNYPDAKRWTVDFPADLIANRKCYEANGYYDTGKREIINDKLTLAFYEKAVNGIFELSQSQFEYAKNVIRASFTTITQQLNITEQNCPTHTAFVTTVERLQNHYNWGWLMFALFENTKLVGYVSISNEGNDIYELHNLSVLPEYRHKGYGRQLLDFCKSKCKYIKLSMIEKNTVLKNWYTANGFVHIGTKKFEHLPFTTGYMEWKLEEKL